MPLNDYKCPKCGLVEELITRSSDPAPRCSKDTCEGSELEKQISVPAPAQFRGDGFYRTSPYGKATK